MFFTSINTLVELERMELEWEHLWLVSLWRLLLYRHVLVFIKIKRKGSVVVAAAAVLAAVQKEVQTKIYVTSM